MLDSKQTVIVVNKIWPHRCGQIFWENRIRNLTMKELSTPLPPREHYLYRDMSVSATKRNRHVLSGMKQSTAKKNLPARSESWDHLMRILRPKILKT